MGKKYNFEYIVIGSGPAGSAAAINLAKAKKRVALVEGHHFGGANLNTRDVPYSVALDFSHTFFKVSSRPEFKNQDLTFSLPTAIAEQTKTVLNAGGNNKTVYEKAGVICLEGYANFIDKNTIAIDNRRFTAKNFILATGSKLNVSEISGTDHVKFLTPENAIKVRRLPKVALVVGGGSTGCEIAEYFAELGTKVIIMESAKRILPREDKEVSEVISNYFTKRLGMMILPNYKVVALEQSNEGKRVIFQNGRTEKAAYVDCIILATGNKPTLDYGLENAGVKYKDSGILVNKLFETSAKNIYAIGDCIGKESSTTRADYEGTILASNLINKAKNQVNYIGLIRATNIFPEVVTIGPTETELIKAKRKYKKVIVNLNEIPAGKINRFDYGFIKLLSDRNNHIIGASIVMPNAVLLSEEISLAIRHKLSALELASTPHTVNSYNYAIKLAAKSLLNKKR